VRGQGSDTSDELAAAPGSRDGETGAAVGDVGRRSQRRFGGPRLVTDAVVAVLAAIVFTVGFILGSHVSAPPERVASAWWRVWVGGRVAGHAGRRGPTPQGGEHTTVESAR
jgi:hypothetical protein